MAQWAESVAVSRESSVSLDVLRALFEMAESSGVSRPQLLRAANLEPGDLAAARLPRSLVYRLCEHAVALSGDPAFGLHWSAKLSALQFIPVSHLIAHAASLRQAFESLFRFHRLLTDQRGYELFERENRVVVQCSSMRGESLQVQRLVAEMEVSGLFRLIRSYGVPARSVQVNFGYAAPSYCEEYTVLFQGAERFDQSSTSIVFDRVFMNSSSSHKDDDVHSALRSIAEQRIMCLTQRTPYAVRVRDALVQRGPSAQADMETIAGSLGMSVRSLRRRLSAEGETYKSVANEVFAIIAKQLLRSTQRTIQEIAFELGFADTSAFHRAFKRRTGMTPQAYRSKELRRE